MSGTQSAPGRSLPLAGRISFGQFLRSLPACEGLGLGNLLARRRILQLDYRAVDRGSDDDPRSGFRSSRVS